MRRLEIAPVRGIGAVLVALAALCPVVRGEDVAVAGSGAWIGVTTRAVTTSWPGISHYSGSGLKVIDVTRGGPADLAGIEQGDILVKIDARRLKVPDDLAAAERAMEPGRPVEVILAKAGGRSIMTFSMRPGSLPWASASTVAVPPAGTSAAADTGAVAGVGAAAGTGAAFGSGSAGMAAAAVGGVATGATGGATAGTDTATDTSTAAGNAAVAGSGGAAGIGAPAPAGAAAGVVAVGSAAGTVASADGPPADTGAPAGGAAAAGAAATGAAAGTGAGAAAGTAGSSGTGAAAGIGALTGAVVGGIAVAAGAGGSAGGSEPSAAGDSATTASEPVPIPMSAATSPAPATPPDTAAAAAGDVRKGAAGLGVRCENLSLDLATALGSKAAQGVLVLAVTSASPADQAGIRPGDIISRVGGEAVVDVDGLDRILATANSPLPIATVRRGTSRLVSAEFPAPTTGPNAELQTTDQLLASLRDEVRSLRDEVRKLREELTNRAGGTNGPHP